MDPYYIYIAKEREYHLYDGANLGEREYDHFKRDFNEPCNNF